MPFINFKTSESITEKQKEELKSVFGRCISVIPGKSEAWLMIEVEGEKDMWFKGEKGSCAIVEVSIYGSASDESYDRLTKELSKAVNAILHIPEDRIYIKYTEIEHWGWNGANF